MYNTKNTQYIDLTDEQCTRLLLEVRFLDYSITFAQFILYQDYYFERYNGNIDGEFFVLDRIKRMLEYAEKIEVSVGYAAYLFYKENDKEALRKMLTIFGEYN